MAVGAKGIVSVASHVIGNEMQEMIAAFQAGEFKKAQITSLYKQKRRKSTRYNSVTNFVIKNDLV